MLIKETEKQGQLKEDYKRIFEVVRRAKPGIYVTLSQVNQFH